MGKAVLLSTQPKWCEKICNQIGENKDGSPIYEKRVEVRKTRPKLDTPFKVYIYCTLKGSNEFFKEDCKGDIVEWNKSKMALKKGKVIGEFICDEITECCSEFYPVEEHPVFEALYRLSEEDEHQSIWDCIASNDEDTVSKFLKDTCLTLEDFREYLGNGEKEFYAWHISNLVIYDKPKELSEFHNFCETYPCCDESCEYYSWTVEGGTECMCDTEKPFKRPPQSWRYVEELSE